MRICAKTMLGMFFSNSRNKLFSTLKSTERDPKREKKKTKKKKEKKKKESLEVSNHDKLLTVSCFRWCPFW